MRVRIGGRAVAETGPATQIIKSLARKRVENPWLTDPQYQALQEKTLNLGLHRAPPINDRQPCRGKQ